MASKGWYAKFMKRNNLHNLKTHGEQGRVDVHEAVKHYPDKAPHITEEFGFTC